MSRGSEFEAHAVADFELSQAGLEILSEVARMLDEIDDMESALGRDGVTVLGSTGQMRVHPAVSELRQHRLALGRLLAQLALPDEDGSVVRSPQSLSAQKAAETRWHLERNRGRG